MARRWTAKEDYIVCKYCVENGCDFSNDADVETMMELLFKSGFTDRTKVAVKARAYDYELLINEQGHHRANNQMQVTYGKYMERYCFPEERESIKSHIRELYSPADVDVLEYKGPSLFTATGLEYLYALEYDATFPMVLQKYLDKKGVKKYKEVYDSIYMKQDTFSSILRGKYKEVKKDNVLRLCVGLKLDLVEAEDLMGSAGYIFSRAIMTDVVVKACIIKHCYDPCIIDEELEENGTKVLFSLD